MKIHFVHFAPAWALLGLLAAQSIGLNSPAWAATRARPSIQTPAPVSFGIEAAITADNSYILGVGPASGMSAIIKTACNSSAGQIFSCGSGPECALIPPLSVQPFIYLVAWGDDGVTNGILGELRPTPSGPVQFTGSDKWRVYATGMDFDGCTGPTPAEINAQIAIANSASGAPGSTSIGWVGTTTTAGCDGFLEIGEPNNAVAPNFTCQNTFQQVCTTGPCGISPQARWMWYRRPGSSCAFLDGNHREFLIFRIPASEFAVSKQRNLYVSSFSTAEIMRYDGITGDPLPSGSNGGAVFVSAGVGGPMLPMGLAFGRDKMLYVSNFARNSVMRFSSTGTPFGASGGTSDATFVTMQSGGLVTPHGLKFGPALTGCSIPDLYVTSIGVTNGVLRYGGLNGSFQAAHTFGANQFPRGLAFSFLAVPGLYVTSDRDLLGYPVTGSGSPIVLDDDPTAITHFDAAVGPNGDVFVTAFESSSVLRYNSLTGYSVFIASGSGGLSNPYGLVFGPGPSPSLYVSSAGTHEILRYDGITGAPMGVFASGGGLTSPTYLTFGPPE